MPDPNMPNASAPPAPPVSDETADVAAPPPIAYQIILDVMQDGTFAVQRVAPSEADELGEEGEPASATTPDAMAETVPEPVPEAYPSIEQALRGVLRVYRDNPVAGEEQAAFVSAFGPREDVAMGRTRGPVPPGKPPIFNPQPRPKRPRYS